jgi:hypothetical protein
MPTMRSRMIGLALLVIGLSLLLRNYRISHFGALLSALLFLIAAVGFANYYLKDDRLWWTILPAGGLLTTSVVILLNSFRLIPNKLGSVIFLLGASLTFWLLRLDPKNLPHLSWTKYPALLLAFGAALAYCKFLGWINSDWIVPILLLVTGILLIYKNRNQDHNSASRA